jgi:ketosteroid isomerase-like protein
MNPPTAITLIARTLLFSVVVLLAGNGKSYAQQSDINKIKAAIEAYHAALGPLAMSKMEPLWAHDTNVMLINPRDRSISVGWDAVNKNWVSASNLWSELKITQTQGPYIQVKGDVAWATGTVNAVGKTKAGAAVSAPTVETDVFEKRGSQ